MEMQRAMQDTRLLFLDHWLRIFVTTGLQAWGTCSNIELVTIYIRPVWAIPNCSGQAQRSSTIQAEGVSVQSWDNLTRYKGLLQYDLLIVLHLGNEFLLFDEKSGGIISMESSGAYI